MAPLRASPLLRLPKPVGPAPHGCLRQPGPLQPPARTRELHRDVAAASAHARWDDAPGSHPGRHRDADPGSLRGLPDDGVTVAPVPIPNGGMPARSTALVSLAAL